MDENVASGQGAASHAKPEGSFGNFIVPATQQLILTNAELSGQNMHSLFLRGKPFEDLGI